MRCIVLLSAVVCLAACQERTDIRDGLNIQFVAKGISATVTVNGKAERDARVYHDVFGRIFLFVPKQKEKTQWTGDRDDPPSI